MGSDLRNLQSRFLLGCCISGAVGSIFLVERGQFVYLEIINYCFFIFLGEAVGALKDYIVCVTRLESLGKKLRPFSYFVIVTYLCIGIKEYECTYFSTVPHSL